MLWALGCDFRIIRWDTELTLHTTVTPVSVQAAHNINHAKRDGKMGLHG
jgi:hypothetical protein